MSNNEVTNKAEKKKYNLTGPIILTIIGLSIFFSPYFIIAFCFSFVKSFPFLFAVICSASMMGGFSLGLHSAKKVELAIKEKKEEKFSKINEHIYKEKDVDVQKEFEDCMNNTEKPKKATYKKFKYIISKKENKKEIEKEKVLEK